MRNPQMVYAAYLIDPRVTRKNQAILPFLFALLFPFLGGE